MSVRKSVKYLCRTFYGHGSGTLAQVYSRQGASPNHNLYDPFLGDLDMFFGGGSSGTLRDVRIPET